MKLLHLWLILAATILFGAAIAHAQTVAPTPPALPGNWIGIGASAQTTGKVLQGATSWIAGAVAVNQKAGIYSYSAYDATLVGGKLQTSVQTGAAVFLRRFGILDTFTFGSVGATQTGAGLASAASTGGIGVLRLKGNFDMILTGQFNKGTGAVARIGFGWTF